MMGTQAAVARVFCDFCLDDHVPNYHQLRGIAGISIPTSFASR
ncbi:hypothetical protein [Methylocystis sp. WRRC1]|nr:hypothetical protein [Methylocystis sp. WRRC1]